jgi:tripartite-type tricarboxylate transporter receptor subunit TctC
MTVVKLRIVKVLFLAGLFFFATALGLRAQSEPFYSGKTVRIIVGFTPGGIYDRWARLRLIEEAKKKAKWTWSIRPARSSRH